MNDETDPGPQFTGKGDAFTRYFFIDRGGEKDLTVNDGLADFEAYIYKPIRADVTTAIVNDVVDEALEKFIDLDADPESLTEEDMENVTQYIGTGFLAAYQALHDPESTD